MPRLSVAFVRAAMLYLLAGFTFGALMLANKGLAFYPTLWRLRPLHIEFLIFGWTLQLIMGVAFWILPRWQDRRGNERIAWLSWLLLNLGILMAVVATIAPDFAPALQLSGRICETAGVLAFALHAWPRIKPLGA
ncbi:MAG: cbb3-type cytochrome c oxidase subunit I [Caldilineales bacterium]|nr:cbb3-type cytochrome c oxidase subunit I [Caldilineales bacterium]